MSSVFLLEPFLSSKHPMKLLFPPFPLFNSSLDSFVPKLATNHLEVIQTHDSPVADISSPNWMRQETKLWSERGRWKWLRLWTQVPVARIVCFHACLPSFSSFFLSPNLPEVYIIRRFVILHWPIKWQSTQLSSYAMNNLPLALVTFLLWWNSTT